jgi:hypothetical protein
MIEQNWYKWGEFSNWNPISLVKIQQIREFSHSDLQCILGPGQSLHAAFKYINVNPVWWSCAEREPLEHDLSNTYLTDLSHCALLRDISWTLPVLALMRGVSLCRATPQAQDTHRIPGCPGVYPDGIYSFTIPTHTQPTCHRTTRRTQRALHLLGNLFPLLRPSSYSSDYCLTPTKRSA